MKHPHFKVPAPDQEYFDLESKLKASAAWEKRQEVRISTRSSNQRSGTGQASRSRQRQGRATPNATEDVGEDDTPDEQSADPMTPQEKTLLEDLKANRKEELREMFKLSKAYTKAYPRVWEELMSRLESELHSKVREKKEFVEIEKAGMDPLALMILITSTYYGIGRSKDAGDVKVELTHQYATTKMRPTESFVQFKDRYLRDLVVYKYHEVPYGLGTSEDIHKGPG
jgi:hypothetical protein